tara:strand:- start:67 stop:591 length:525 start_codon:yes stop_codon:yes gene_type:complete
LKNKSGLDYYTKKEILLRILWSIAFPIWRFSPRHFWFWRRWMINIFGGYISNTSKIYPSVKISQPWNLKIGDNTVIGWGVKLYCLGKIKIGNNVVISQGAHLCAGSHKFEDQSFELLKSDIIISDNSWLAAECFVGNGVHVGEKSIIGARSVVFSDVLPNEVVVGNPAKKIKNL